jgi:hypothetical protein
VITAVVAEATGVVVILNVADDAPAATVTLAGTAATALPEVTGIVKPPVGAGPFSVSVPVEVNPPRTALGDRLIVESVGAETIMLTVFVVVPKVAVNVTVVFAATGLVLTVKLTVEAPAGTVTVAGTTAAPTFDDTETAVPPVGAFPLRKIDPTAAVPPTTVLGATAM